MTLIVNQLAQAVTNERNRSMNRISQVAVMTVAASAAVISAAGGAAAYDGHRGASAEAKAVNSPGFLSGNVDQTPIDMPINICGNSYNLEFGFANPAIGNTCLNA
jgi:hypothetical protein